jgi:hypothetical protein
VTGAPRLARCVVAELDPVVVLVEVISCPLEVVVLADVVAAV